MNQRPPRFNFQASNTPLDQVTRMSAALVPEGNLPLFIKRDDQCAAGLAPFPSGKTRKLEYIMHDAIQHGATAIIVSGNCQSNHARQVAYFAWKLRMECHCVYQNDTPWDTRFENLHGGNSQLAQMYGADIHVVENAGEYVERLKAELEFTGKRVYVSSRGGSASVGDLGYMHCFDEIKQQLFSQYDIDEATIFVCSGSGGTHAGLALAAKLHGNDRFRVVGVPNKRTPTEQFVEVQKSVKNLQRVLGIKEETIFLNFETIDIPYGKVTPQVAQFSQWFFKHSGVLLDPTYSVKPAMAMVDCINSRRIDGPVVFVNGGCPVNVFINPQEYQVK